MIALKIEANQKPQKIEIKNNLRAIQREIGDVLNCIYPFQDESVVLCDDFYGQSKQLPLNRPVISQETEEVYDIIRGTFIIAGISDTGLISLTEEQIQKFTEMYNEPTVSIKHNGKLYGCTFLEYNNYDEIEK